ncbi:THO2 plays a role in transcriptional elongation [Sorochytrium milnesiophthora]
MFCQQNLFYMRKTRSAFVNFAAQEDAERAAVHFHGVLLKGSRIVARSRLNKQQSQQHIQLRAAPQLPSMPVASFGMLTPLYITLDDKGVAIPPATYTPLYTQPYSPMSIASSLGGPASVYPAPNIQPQAPVARQPQKIHSRYFVMKSVSAEDMDFSMRHGVWATQLHLEALLDNAYRPSTVPAALRPLDRGRWGRSFQVQWILAQRLPFACIRHLHNPWNNGREVKVSRDGTELEPSVGHAVITEFYRFLQHQHNMMMQGQQLLYVVPGAMPAAEEGMVPIASPATGYLHPPPPPAAGVMYAFAGGDATIDETLEQLQQQDAALIVDVISVLDRANAAAITQGDADKPSLRSLVNALHAAEWFPSQLLVEHLDAHLLEECIAQSAYIQRVQDRLRTQHQYTVPLFSIAYEDAEGYMNIVMALQTMLENSGDTGTATDQESVQAAQQLWQKIENILVTHNVAYFRIIELLLHTFAARVASHHAVFVAVFQQCPWRTLADSSTPSPGHAPIAAPSADDIGHILGFLFKDRDPQIDKFDRVLQRHGLVSSFLSKLSSIGAQTAAQPASADALADKEFLRLQAFVDSVLEDASQSNLYLVGALLIKHGIARFESVWSHLYPRDQTVLVTQYQEQHLARLSHLSSVRRYLQPDNEMPPSAELLQPDRFAEWPASIAIDLPECQKAGLLQAMLAVGATKQALDIVGRIPQYARLFPGIAAQIARTTKSTIDPLTRRIYGNLAVERMSTPFKPLPTLSTTPYPDRQYYFCRDWAAEIHTIDNFPAIHDIIIPQFLAPLRPVIADQLPLVLRLCKLGKLHIQTDNSNDVRQQWLAFVRDYAFPCMCFAQPSQQLNDAIWDLLRNLPYRERFATYDAWKRSTDSSAEVKAAVEVADNETRWIMKQVSSATLKASQRKLAKLSLNNPLVVFARVVELVQNYDHDMTDIFKFCTPLGYDVLVYVVYTSLSNPLRSRVKEDMINTADWLIKTATFVGKFYKRYPEADFQPILDYTRRFARRGSYHDTAVLSAMIEHSAGIKIIQDIPDDVIYASESGKTLRFDAILSYDLYSRTSVDWLVKHVKQDGFLREMLFLMCQMLLRLKDIPAFEMMSYEEAVQGAQFRAQLDWFDKVQAIFCQMLNFVRLLFKSSELADVVPDMVLLTGDAVPDPSLAFSLIRLGHQCDLPKHQEGSAFMHDLEAPLMQKLMGSANDMHLPHGSTVLPYAYALFWTSTTYDLVCMDKLYASRKLLYSNMLKDRDSRARDISSMRYAMKQIEHLEKDKKGHTEHGEHYRASLQSHMELLFDSSADAKQICKDLLQHCLYRRMLFNPVEATFCASFLLYLHRLNVPRFSTFYCLDQIFSHAYIMYGLTMDQCKSYGRMLKLLLQELQRWQADQDVFVREALGEYRLYGFALHGEVRPDEEGRFENDSLMSHATYCNTLAKWQAALTNAIHWGLYSENSALIRCASFVLCGVASVFPVIDRHRDVLERVCKRLETVDEFKLPIKAALGGMHRRNFVTAAAFGDVRGQSKTEFHSTLADANASASASASDRTEQVEATATQATLEQPDTNSENRKRPPSATAADEDASASKRHKPDPDEVRLFPVILHCPHAKLVIQSGADTPEDGALPPQPEGKDEEKKRDMAEVLDSLDSLNDDLDDEEEELLGEALGSLDQLGDVDEADVMPAHDRLATPGSDARDSTSLLVTGVQFNSRSVVGSRASSPLADVTSSSAAIVHGVAQQPSPALQEAPTTADEETTPIDEVRASKSMRGNGSWTEVEQDTALKELDRLKQAAVSEHEKHIELSFRLDVLQSGHSISARTFREHQMGLHDVQNRKTTVKGQMETTLRVRFEKEKDHATASLDRYAATVDVLQQIRRSVASRLANARYRTEVAQGEQQKLVVGRDELVAQLKMLETQVALLEDLVREETERNEEFKTQRALQTKRQETVQQAEANARKAAQESKEREKEKINAVLRSITWHLNANNPQLKSIIFKVQKEHETLPGTEPKVTLDLSCFQSIHVLGAADSHVHAVEGFDSNRQMRAVDLSNNSLGSLQFLRDVKELVVLFLRNTQLRTLEDMAHMSTILWLDASANDEHLFTLEHTDNSLLLQHLNISENQFATFPELKGLMLRQLYVQRNVLTELRISSWMPMLQVLDLDNNQIESIEPLQHCLCLSELYLRNNFIEGALEDYVTPFVQYFHTIVIGVSMEESQKFERLLDQISGLREILQEAYVRMKDAKLREERRNKAALTVQRIWKGYRVRTIVRKMKTRKMQVHWGKDGDDFDMSDLEQLDDMLLQQEHELDLDRITQLELDPSLEPSGANGVGSRPSSRRASLDPAVQGGSNLAHGKLGPLSAWGGESQRPTSADSSAGTHTPPMHHRPGEGTVRDSIVPGLSVYGSHRKRTVSKQYSDDAPVAEHTMGRMPTQNPDRLPSHNLDHIGAKERPPVLEEEDVGQSERAMQMVAAKEKERKPPNAKPARKVIYRWDVKELGYPAAVPEPQGGTVFPPIAEDDRKQKRTVSPWNQLVISHIIHHGVPPYRDPASTSSSAPRRGRSSKGSDIPALPKLP